MGDTTTPVLGLVKPQVGASRSTWGNKWNGNADGIETYCTNLFAEITTLQQQIAGLQSQIDGLEQEMVNAAVPIGTVIAWPENYSWPQGYLNCNGGLVAVATFPLLFARLGTIWGGDGVNTFGVPDYRGCVLASMDEGTGRLGGLIPQNPGALGGEPLHTLSWNEMPQHTHSGYTDWQGTHAHNVYINTFGGGGSNGFLFESNQQSSAIDFPTDNQGDHYHNLEIDASGAYWAHNNLQVTAMIWWLIRAW